MDKVDATLRAAAPSSERFHVCMVTPFPPWRSGVAEYARCLAAELAKELRVTVVTHAVPGAPLDESSEGVRILRVWKPEQRLSPLSLFRTIRRLRPDVVHLQFGLYGREFGGKVGEPTLVLLLLLRLARIPTVVTLHSLWGRDQVRDRAFERTGNRFIAALAVRGIASYYRWLARLANSVPLSVASPNSTAVRKFARMYGIPERRLGAVLFGVSEAPSMSRERARERLGLPSRAPVFLVLGFVYEDKGIDVAIRALGLAASRLRRASLLVVGPSLPERGQAYLHRIEADAAGLPLETSVRFEIGYMPEPDLGLRLAAADAVVVPYRRSVGTSSVVHQALGAGRATIATTSPWHAMPDCGVLEVPPEDPIALADRLVQVSEEPALRTRLEDEARHAAQVRRWPV